jgi:O-antigen/teichoic acid export membrane protein/polysaccharide pyruvyl transferase WcaK-like protein
VTVRTRRAGSIWSEAGVVLAGNVLARGLGFLFPIVLARAVAKHDFGTVYFFIATGFFVSELVLTGFPTAMTRYMAAEGPGKAWLSSAVVGGIPLLAISLVAGESLAAVADAPAGLMSMVVCGLTIDAYYFGLLRGLKRFKLLASYRVSANLTQIVLLLAAIAAGVESTAVAVAIYSFVYLVPIAVIELLRRPLRDALRGSARPDRALVRRLTRFALPALVTGTAYAALTQADVLFVRLLAPAALADYAAARSLAQPVVLVPFALGIVMLPAVASAGERDRWRLLARALVVTALLGAVLAAAYAVGSATAVDLALPASFADAAESLPVLAGALAVLGVYSMLSQFWLGIAKPGSPAVALGVGALVAIGLQFVLTAPYGAVGAATAGGCGIVCALLILGARTLRDRASAIARADSPQAFTSRTQAPTVDSVSSKRSADPRPGATLKEIALAASNRAALPKDDAEVLLVRTLGRTAPRVPDAERRGVLLLPSQAPGSLGDEAMVESIARHLAADGKPVTVVEYDRANRWTPRPSIADSVDLTDYFHVDRRFAATSWAALRTFARVVGRYERLIVVGADVIDGFYSASRTVKRLQLALLAADAGMAVTILNFSFNANPERRAVRLLRTLPSNVRLVARDEISRERIRATIGRDCGLAADVAFLLHPDETPRVRSAAAWAAQKRRDGRMVIGLNANHQTFDGHDRADLDDLVSIYRATVTGLVEGDPPAAVLFIPHDWRGSLTEERFADEIRAELPAGVREHVEVARGPYSAMEAKGLCAALDVLITGRMHLAIAGLGQAIPVASVPYQGKFEGLMRHFDLPELVLDLDRALADRSLEPQMRPLFERRATIADAIAVQLGEIRQRSAAAFA